MNITFNTSIASLNDFISLIVLGYNDIDSMQVFKELGFVKSVFVKDMEQKIWDGIDKNTPGLSLIFQQTRGNTSFIRNEYNSKLIEIDSIDNLLEILLKSPENELLLALLKFYDEIDNPDSFYSEMIKTSHDLFEFVRNMKISATQKMELLELSYNPEIIFEPLSEILHRIRRRVNRFYNDNSEMIKKFQKLMTVRVRNEGEHLLESIRSTLIPDSSFQGCDIVFSYTLAQEFSIGTLKNGNVFLIVLGYNYEKTLKSFTKKDDIYTNEQFFKAFADKNRIKMVQLLSKDELYVGEISKKCKLVISTTSYHLDILLAAGIISGQIRNKRVYYKLKKDFVIDKFNYLSEAMEKTRF